MRKCILMLGLLGLAFTNANAASIHVDSCEQIRSRIEAQVGVLPKADTDLLQKLGAQPECRFSAAEVYRAAYGDKPMPINDSGRRRAKRDRDHHDHY